MSDDEFDARRGYVGLGLAARKLDALAVSFRPNVRYLTGFRGSNGMLLALADEAVFFTDPRYAIQSGLEVSCETRVAKGPLLPALVAEASRRGVRHLGFEQAHLSFEDYRALDSRRPARLRLEPVSGWVEQLRTIKSAVEIALIRKSVETNSRAFEQVAARVRPGMRETDLAAELEYRMRRLGAEKPAFETIVAAGRRSALPHAQPTTAPVARRELLLVDMGAMQDGYASDMTRMLHLGRPDAKVRRLYRAVLEAQAAAIAAVRPGVTAGHVDRQARRVLRAEKLDRAFVHSTGHGLGLEIHEPPRIGRKDKTRLQAGMVITIEPGVYLEGYGGIRIEDTVVVTSRGCDILTPTAKHLRVV